MRLRQEARPGTPGEAAKWTPDLAVSVRVQVRFRPRRQGDRAVELPDGATAGQLVDAVGERRDNIVVVRAGAPIHEEEPLRPGEELLLLSAASGG